MLFSICRHFGLGLLGFKDHCMQELDVFTDVKLSMVYHYKIVQVIFKVSSGLRTFGSCKYDLVNNKTLNSIYS